MIFHMKYQDINRHLTNPTKGYLQEWILESSTPNAVTMAEEPYYISSAWHFNSLLPFFFFEPDIGEKTDMHT